MYSKQRTHGTTTLYMEDLVSTVCSVSPSVTHWLSHPFKPLTHSFARSLARSLTHSLIHSLIHSLTHTLTLTHSFTHSLTQSITHSLTHSLTHSNQLANIYRYWYTRPSTISLFGFENSLMCIMYLLIWLM